MTQQRSIENSLAADFWTHAALTPQRVALHVDSIEYSYRQLETAAINIACALDESGASKNVGILSHRKFAAYAGILGTLGCGRAYVPLGAKFPPQRVNEAIRQAQIDTLIVDASVFDSLDELLLTADDAISRILVCHSSNKGHACDLNEKCVLLDLNTPVDADHGYPRPVNLSSAAYIMFTSGTTGTPKGVPISHGNGRHYVDALTERFSFEPDDRFSQTFDLTFDLSVHDMFLCWSSGSALYVLPDSALLAPAKYIREHELTIWFSVPSMIGFLHFRQQHI